MQSGGSHGLLRQYSVENVFITKEYYIQVRLLNSLYRPGNHLFRAQFATHGIQGNTQCHVLLHFFFKLNYSSFIVSATAAAKPV
jgi:hypothetical protein